MQFYKSHNKNNQPEETFGIFDYSYSFSCMGFGGETAKVIPGARWDYIDYDTATVSGSRASTWYSFKNCTVAQRGVSAHFKRYGVKNEL